MALARPLPSVPVGTLLVAVALVGCSESEPPTGPMSGGDPAASLRLSHLPDPPDLGGPVSLPIPPDNKVNWGGVGWIPLFEVPERTFVHVVVRGGVTVTDNSQVWCSETPPDISLAGSTVGPAGEGGEFQVTLRLNGVGGSDQNLYLTQPAGDDEGMSLEHVGYLSQGTIQGRRRGGGPSCSEANPDGTRTNRGGYRLSGNQVVEATATHPIEIHASPTSVEEGGTVTFTMSGEFGHEDRRWYWQKGDTAATPGGLIRSSAQWVCPGDQGDYCTISPVGSGRMYARASIQGRFLTDPTPSEVVRVGVEESVLTLESVVTGGEGVSFLTRGDEGVVSAKARLTPAGDEQGIEWTIADDPSDEVDAPWPGQAAPGPEAKWVIPAPGRARWETTDHQTRNGLEVKSLAYRVSAHVESDGRMLEAGPYPIRQDEIDTLRQEYVDFERVRVPDREEFGTPAAAHFSSAEINHGDYSVYLARPELLEGLEEIRSFVRSEILGMGLPFSGIVLTSAYRNPTHHTVHVGASSVNSQHQFGTAADIRIRDWGGGLSRLDAFELLHGPARRLEACWEPEATIRSANSSGVLTHAHIDWRDGDCPDSWRI